MEKSITFMAEDAFSGPFWDEEGTDIGDCESFFIDDVEYDVTSLCGLKEWFLQANKFDPYTDVGTFTNKGREEWVNQGYEYVKLLRKMIPKNIALYYGFWHQFGDGYWRYCKAYIAYKF